MTSHVLRKSLLTDLEDLGVPQLVRSIVAGHKVGAVRMFLGMTTRRCPECGETDKTVRDWDRWWCGGALDS